MKDLVLPNRNERELIEMAQKLGIKEIILAYSGRIPRESILETKTRAEIKSTIGKTIDSREKAEFIVAKSTDQDRGIIEGRRANLIYGFEMKSRKEFMNIRNSGMNQVIAKLMHDKKVSYGIDFSSILALDDANRQMIMGRIAQNLKICRKYKVDVFIGSFASDALQMRSVDDMMAFLRVLGKKA